MDEREVIPMSQGTAHQYAAYCSPCGRNDRAGFATKQNAAAMMMQNAILAPNDFSISFVCSFPFFASCAANGNLNFNCLLVLMPSEVLDSVVVHELCHRRHMNHSKEFYAEIDRVFPDYRRWNKWLKDNGGVYLKMVGK